MAYTCTFQALICCKFTVLNNDCAIPSPKKCPLSDLREYAIADYFRIFLPHISRLHGPHIFKKKFCIFLTCLTAWRSLFRGSGAAWSQRTGSELTSMKIDVFVSYYWIGVSYCWYWNCSVFPPWHIQLNVAVCTVHCQSVLTTKILLMMYSDHYFDVQSLNCKTAYLIHVCYWCVVMKCSLDLWQVSRICSSVFTCCYL